MEVTEEIIVFPRLVRFETFKLVEVIEVAVKLVGLKFVAAKFVKNAFVDVTLVPVAVVNPKAPDNVPPVSNK